MPEIVDTICKEVEGLIDTVKANDELVLANEEEFRPYVINTLANNLKSIFKRSNDIKNELPELYKSLNKCDGASDVIKAKTTMDAMKKLNAYINKIKEAVTNHKSSLGSANDIVLALTALQSHLYKIQKVLEDD